MVSTDTNMSLHSPLALAVLDLQITKKYIKNKFGN